jgi:hypothetical protein
LDVVRWALVRVRTASIDRHAHEQPPAGQVDPDVIKQQNEGEPARRHGDSSADGATATWGPVPAKLKPWSIKLQNFHFMRIRDARRVRRAQRRGGRQQHMKQTLTAH